MASRSAVLDHDNYFSLTSLSAEAYLSLGSMEGMDQRPWPEVAAAPVPAVKTRAAHWPGYLLAAFSTALAYAVHYLPFAPFRLVTEAGLRRPIGAALLAILVGVGIRNLWRGAARAAAGCRRVVRGVLPATIVLTGAGLNLLTLAQVGATALVIVMICISLAAAAGCIFGRWFGLRPPTALLIGAGTAICGNSAIVAVAPLVDAEDEDLVLSIATVNLFGLLAMLALPLAGGFLRLDGAAFGVWCGAAVHSVPQAVAAGFAHSPEAGALATMVKLVRVTLLAPLVFVLGFYYARRHRGRTGISRRPSIHYARLVPWFVWGFVVMALCNTMGLIPNLSFPLGDGRWGGVGGFDISLVRVLSDLSTLLLTMAMAAIGLELDVRLLAGAGSRALFAGGATTLVLVIGSLLLIQGLL